MEAYSILAKYYNELTKSDSDYNVWAQYCSNVLKEHNAYKGVDLACGTGKMTHRLKKLGFDIMGIDKSSDMLNIARNGGKCLFIMQDMLDFQLNKPVDFVTVINDGINYISSIELDKVLNNIHKALKSDGILIFDISTEYKLSHIIGNNVFYVDNEDETLLWSNELSNDSVTMDLVLFEKQTDVYTRRDEYHLQYIHTTQSVLDALNKYNFELIALTESYTDKPIQQNTERATFVAKRK